MERIDDLMKYLNKENLVPTTKRLLNFAFVLIVSSFIFSHFYYEYKLNNWNDFQAHFKFILEGNFIVPLGIFILIWSSTNFVGIYSMAIINYLITEKFKSKIINISINRSEYYQQAEKINNLFEDQTNVQPKKEWFVTIYESLKKSISKERYQKLISDLEKRKSTYESDFVLLVRSVLAIGIVAANSSVIGWFLMSLILLFQLFYTIFIIIKFQFSELLPVAIQKYSSEMELYIRNHYPDISK